MQYAGSCMIQSPPKANVRLAETTVNGIQGKSYHLVDSESDINGILQHLIDENIIETKANTSMYKFMYAT